ncbi:MAG: ATP-grasp domain-containing protein [Corallococcus sp.]|nr:ATP-grasp domain-containing protein [Corallococcus sp.]
MNIAIIYGGKSCEHDISIITACLSKGFFKGNVYSLYFSKENECFLVPNDWTPKKHMTEKLNKRATFLFGRHNIAVYKNRRIVDKINIDVAVNCCHGLHGEDGRVAALCAMANIPLVGSNMISSVVAIDKTLTKTVLSSYGFPVIRGISVRKSQTNCIDNIVDSLNFPIIVKPGTLGSSIGVRVCKNREELVEGLASAFDYDVNVLCEEALENFYELNCSAFKVNNAIETSNVDCPFTLNDILTFNDKYIANEKYDRKVCNAPQDVKERVKAMTEQIYKQLNFSGVIRVDYLFDKETDTIYVNEINSIPGSLAYGLWEQRFTRTEFGEALVEEAVRDFRESQQLIYTFESNVLHGGGNKKK